MKHFRKIQSPFLLPSTSFLRSHSTQSSGRAIRIVEVSPRDGLQNEQVPLSVDTKALLIARLARHGFTTIEAGSFVSPKVKQMANTSDVVLHPAVRAASASATLQLLVPNERGLSASMETMRQASEDGGGSQPVEISIFAAATESFSKANLNATVAEALDRLGHVAQEAISKGFKVRGYVSCAAGCPFEGAVEAKQARNVAKALWDMGCYEISVADTIGVGTPNMMEDVFSTVARDIPVTALAAHCHDTYGAAIANILHLAKMGVMTFDSSIAGLGGCPFAPGASGNVATEDLIYAVEMEGYDTGLLFNLDSKADRRLSIVAQLAPIAETGQWISEQLGRQSASRVGRAVLARTAGPESR